MLHRAYVRKVAAELVTAGTAERGCWDWLLDHTARLARVVLLFVPRKILNSLNPRTDGPCSENMERDLCFSLLV